MTKVEAGDRASKKSSNLAIQDSERFKYAAERYEKGMSLADVFEVLGTHGHAFGPLPKEESI